MFKLKASNIIQESGAVFDPDYFLIDESTNLVYRKEMFNNENHISAEYIIRDKRYTVSEISSHLVSTGFKVLKHYYVQAGRWNIHLEPTDIKAKEILIFAQKVSTWVK